MFYYHAVMTRCIFCTLFKSILSHKRNSGKAACLIIFNMRLYSNNIRSTNATRTRTLAATSTTTLTREFARTPVRKTTPSTSTSTRAHTRTSATQSTTTTRAPSRSRARTTTATSILNQHEHKRFQQKQTTATTITMKPPTDMAAIEGYYCRLSCGHRVRYSSLYYKYTTTSTT